MSIYSLKERGFDHYKKLVLYSMSKTKAHLNDGCVLKVHLQHYLANCYDLSVLKKSLL